MATDTIEVASIPSRNPIYEHDIGTGAFPMQSYLDTRVNFFVANIDSVSDEFE